MTLTLLVCPPSGYPHSNGTPPPADQYRPGQLHVQPVPDAITLGPVSPQRQPAVHCNSASVVSQIGVECIF